MCKGNCELCPRLIISSAVSFTAGNLEINIPAGTYNNGCKYCIVVAQSIPTTATVDAPVYVTIGTDTTLYPLNKCDCNQVTVCSMRTRTRYPVMVKTTGTGGSFRLLRKICCAPNNNLASLPVAADAGGGGA